MASFSDDFNRANGALGANWAAVTGYTAMEVVSNAAKSAGGGNCMSVVATGTVTFTADQSAQITVSNLGSFDYVGCVVRVSGGTGYGLVVDGRALGNSKLCKFTSGALSGATTIGSGGYAIAAGDVLKLEAVGTTLNVYKNGSLIDSQTDATYSSGQPGMYAEWGNSGLGIADSFVGADVGGGGGSVAKGTLAFFLDSH